MLAWIVLLKNRHLIFAIMSYGNYQFYYEPKFPAASSAYKHGSRGLHGTPQITVARVFNELHLLWVNVLITLSIWVPVCSLFWCKMLTVITLSAKPYFLCMVFWILTLLDICFWIYLYIAVCLTSSHAHVRLSWDILGNTCLLFPDPYSSNHDI